MSDTARGLDIGWLTEGVRLTLFPVPGKNVATNSWEEISGGLPTQVNREPAFGVSQEAGPFNNGRLALAWISQTRAGWGGEPGRCRAF